MPEYEKRSPSFESFSTKQNLVSSLNDMDLKRSKGFISFLSAVAEKLLVQLSQQEKLAFSAAGEATSDGGLILISKL